VAGLAAAACRKATISISKKAEDKHDGRSGRRNIRRSLKASALAEHIFLSADWQQRISGAKTGGELRTGGRRWAPALAAAVSDRDG